MKNKAYRQTKKVTKKSPKRTVAKTRINRKTRRK